MFFTKNARPFGARFLLLQLVFDVKRNLAVEGKDPLALDEWPHDFARSKVAKGFVLAAVFHECPAVGPIEERAFRCLAEHGPLGEHFVCARIAYFHVSEVSFPFFIDGEGDTLFYDDFVKRRLSSPNGHFLRLRFRWCDLLGNGDFLDARLHSEHPPPGLLMLGQHVCPRVGGFR